VSVPRGAALDDATTTRRAAAGSDASRGSPPHRVARRPYYGPVRAREPGPPRAAAPPPLSERLETVSVLRESTTAERLEDAGPLVLIAVVCFFIALALHSSNPAAGVGHLAVWALFVALGLVASVAAVVSYAISQPEEEEEIVVEPKRRRKTVAAEPPRRVAIPNAVVRTLPRRANPRAAPLVLRAADPLPVDAPPEVDRESEGPETEELPRELWEESLPEEPVPRSAESMIDEIDGLWFDLERLRRRPRSA
jgi:hypothetical protein